MSRIANFCDWLLRSPLIWGIVGWLLFDNLVQRFGGAWLNEYVTKEWMHRVTTCVFFVGMAALVIRGFGLLGQLSVFSRQLLDPPFEGGQPVSEAGELIDQLDSQPSWLQSTYLVTRLKDALGHVRKTDSADALEEKLRGLEEADYDRMSSSYSMVRVIIGVVPLLGFLGTVNGIAAAIAELSLSPEELEASLGGVTGGLAVAFSTTALALALSIVLVFAKLIVERLENDLLARTGTRAYQELVGRFEQFGSANDPHVATVTRMCDQVVRAVEVMAARQADVWKSTIDETHERWALATSTAGEQLTRAVSTGLEQSLRDHATGLTEGVESQLAKLNAGLMGQADTLSAVVGAQTAAVNEAVELQGEAIKRQADALAAALGAQAASIGEAAGQQSQAITTAIAQQVEVLREAAQQHTGQLGAGANEMLGNLRNGLERMAELLVEALEKHGQTLTRAEEELATENRRHLSEVEAALGEAMVVAADRQEKLIGRSEQLLRGMQASIAESAGATIAHQEQLVKQGEVLLKVVDKTGQVQSLQDSLNRNLDALSRGHNFEETLMSLSAAIQLLSARAGKAVVDGAESNRAA